MRTRLALFVLLLVSLVFSALFARRLIESRAIPHERFQDRRLRLLTYSAFMAPSGPGAAIINRFEKENECKVEVVAPADAGLLLERMKLAPAFDVVIGLDQLLLEDARVRFEWLPLQIDKSGWHAEPAQVDVDERFAAFDWSPLTFLHRKGGVVPGSFAALTSAEFAGQFAIQDARSSTPGLQFFRWVQALKGADAGLWLRAFKPNVKAVSPSWSLAYALFARGEARFVFTHLTSLAYQRGLPDGAEFDVLSFPEGHPVQVEFAAVPKSCRDCDLARALVQALHSEDSQRLLMTRNYMFPVRKGIERATVFAGLPKLKMIATPAEGDLREWTEVFGP